MANFKGHLTLGVGVGLGYGGLGWAVGSLEASTCLVAGGLCTVGSLLPDLDSDTSRPLREAVAFLATMFALMIAAKLKDSQHSTEVLVLIATGVYLGLRYGLSATLSAASVHRGMFHSLPAAIIAGQVAWLLIHEGTMAVRVYKAAAVSLGYLSHLLLDEGFGFLSRRKSRSPGCLKLLGKDFIGNLICYTLLIALGYLIYRQVGGGVVGGEELSGL